MSTFEGPRSEPLNLFCELYGALSSSLKIDRKTWSFDFCLITWYTLVRLSHKSECSHFTAVPAQPYQIGWCMFSNWNGLKHLITPFMAIQCLWGTHCHFLLPFPISIQMPLCEVLLHTCCWSVNGFLTFDLLCLCCVFLYIFTMCGVCFSWLLLAIAFLSNTHQCFLPRNKAYSPVDLLTFSVPPPPSTCILFFFFATTWGKKNRIFKAAYTDKLSVLWSSYAAADSLISREGQTTLSRDVLLSLPFPEQTVFYNRLTADA